MKTMFEYLENYPWAYAAIILSAMFVIFAIVGILIVRNTINRKSLKENHDVAGFVFTNLGVLYAVLLGFTVVNVQQRFDKIKDVAEQEAGYLSALYRDSEVFSEKNRHEIRESIKTYCFSALNEEWASMAHGESHPNTEKAFKNILKAYYKVEIANRKQEVWYSESVSKLNELMSARLARILGSRESLGSEMWTLLILGAVVMVAFIWFFSIESLTSHILMASVLAVSTAFLIFLIYSLDTAYSGNVSIPPEALQRALDNFNSL